MFNKIDNPIHRKNILLIAKEAANNIAKYSDAQNVSIILNKNPKNIILFIKDDGKGFEPKKLSEGNGLQNIQRRCKLLDGQCDINTEIGKGVTIVCTFPLAIIGQK